MNINFYEAFMSRSCICTQTSLIVNQQLRRGRQKISTQIYELHGTTARNKEATKHGKQRYRLHPPDQSP